MKGISLPRVEIVYIFYFIIFQAITGANITGLATISSPCRPKGRNQEKHSKHTISIQHFRVATILYYGRQNTVSSTINTTYIQTLFSMALNWPPIV